MRLTDRGWAAIFIVAFLAAFMATGMWEAHLMELDGTRGGTQ